MLTVRAGRLRAVYRRRQIQVLEPVLVFMRMLLSSDEIHALHALAEGRVRTRISEKDAARLIDLGYARGSADGVAITPRGREAASQLHSMIAAIGDVHS